LLLKELNQAIYQKGVHGYGCFSEDNLNELRTNVSKFYKKRFSVDLSPTFEVAEVNGTKTAIFQLLQLLIKENDRVLIPSPSYTVYHTCVQLLNGKVISFPCEKHTFYPDLDKLTPEQLQEAKVLVLCSLGNPTSAVLTKDYLEKAVVLAKKYQFKIIHDIAYGELYLTEKNQ
jgi:alanine-synthesizing transaminase